MADNTLKPYKESDFVDVVDAAGDPLEHPVPKAWLGTDLLEAGVKKAGKASKSSGSTGGSGSTGSDGAPAGNASRDDWVAYAKAQGATDADLVDADGNDLGRDELREKYQPTPA
jgi:hypothetical protein